MAGVFADLNIVLLPEDRSPKSQGLRARVRTALKLGYEIIALNTIVTDIPEKPTKKGKTQFMIPPPFEFKLTPEDQAFAQIKGRTPKILNRITLVCEEPGQLYKLTSPAVRQYDIIAVQPNAEKLLLALSNTFDVDIVSFNVQENLLMLLRRPQIRMMMNHGVSFEINYTPAIKDQSVRRSTIAFAQCLIEACRGKNVILSSAAEKVLELRGPYDVANLGLLFGLHSGQSKAAVSTNIRSLLLHAEARKLGKGLISVVVKSDLPPEEKWKLSSSSTESCTTESKEMTGKKRKHSQIN